MNVDIVYIRKSLMPAWRVAFESVVEERIYLDFITPPFDPDYAFPNKMIDHDWPMYCATAGYNVVGWADIVPVDRPESAHRGVLGMGVVASHRGSGIGGRLLEACLAHAPRSNIEKVELTVYANNAPAIALYRRFQFVETGIVRDYRRLDGVTYDSVLMERWLR